MTYLLKVSSINLWLAKIIEFVFLIDCRQWPKPNIISLFQSFLIIGLRLWPIVKIAASVIAWFPLTWISCNTVFSRNQNARNAGNRCIYYLNFLILKDTKGDSTHKSFFTCHKIKVYPSSIFFLDTLISKLAQCAMTGGFNLHHLLNALQIPTYYCIYFR